MSESIAGAGQHPDGRVEQLREQLNLLETDARESQVRYEAWRKRYEGWHVAVGIPAVGLGAAAGVSAFASVASNVLVGCFAAAAAALTAVQTAIRPDVRSRFNQEQMSAMRDLAHDVAILRDFRLEELTLEEALDGYTRLERRYNALRAATRT